MLVAFAKLNGAGNDFILIDDREGKLKLQPSTVASLCHRQNGIGADGLILQRESKQAGIQWEWEFFNSDGSSAEMCGNGARCFARFVTGNGSESGSEFRIKTLAGVIEASVSGEEISVGLTTPRDARYGIVLQMEERTCELDFINTGVPHAVLFLDNVESAMVQEIGQRIRFHSYFAPKGTNVNFAGRVDENHIRLRTYERGVEAETLACGTGVTASALLAARRYGWKSPVLVDVKNGDTLKVSFVMDGENYTKVTLTGPAKQVFTGHVEITDMAQ